MTQARIMFLVGMLLAALVLLANTLFTVYQTQQALVLEFGKPVAIIRDPGLHAKWPFIQNVEIFDQRVLDFNADPKELIASDQKRLIVDAYVLYRIIDPLKFYQTVRDERIMASRLNSILESTLRQKLGSKPLNDIVSNKRSQIMREVRDAVNAQTTGTMPSADDSTEEKQETSGIETSPGFGVEVVDVRIMRADLPKENSQAIFRRMQTEREREAKEYRAKGAEEAQKIRSEAEKERTVTLAEATKQAETIRGEGDAKASKVFADAFSRDPEFYEFYRTMQAYRKTLGGDDTKMILSPDSRFLRHLEKGE